MLSTLLSSKGKKVNKKESASTIMGQSIRGYRQLLP